MTPVLLRTLAPTLIAAVILAACAAPAEVETTATPEPPTATAVDAPTATATEPSPPTATPPPTATAEPTPLAFGPDEYPEGINPLTGLPVDDPARLERRPLLVKVSNESNEIRPISGYGAADHLWVHQAEGWGQTRFTAVFLSESPEYVGSVRSVRPIDSDVLIPMYDGILAYSGASIGMNYHFEFETPYWQRAFRELADRDHLVRLEAVPEEGVDFYHRLFARPEAVWDLAEERGNHLLDQPVSGLAFSEEPPSGGTPATEFQILFEERLGGLFRFEYDETSGQWLFFHTDRKDRETGETPEIDRLTGEQLAFSNIVVLFAEHEFTGWVEDMASGASALDPDFDGEGEGFLVRDGTVYPITWQNDESEEGALITLLAENGEVIPLRPGKTFFATSVDPEQLFYGQFAATILTD